MPSRCANSTSRRRASSLTALCCRKPRAASTGSTPTRCCSPAPMARAWRRHRAMRAPCGCGGAASSVDQAPVIFETHGRPYAGLWQRRRHRADSRASGSSTRSTSSTIDIWLGDEAGASAKLDLPTDIWMQAHRRLARRSSCAQTWTVGGRHLCRRRRARHFAVGVPRRQPRLHRAVRAGTAARVAGVFLEPRQARAVDPRRVAAGVRDLHAVGRGLEPRRRCAACPTSASSTSGALDRHESESNGDLLANVQDPLTPPSLLLIERGVESPTRAEAGAEDIQPRRPAW